MYKDWDADRRRFERSPFPAWAFETIKFLYEQRGVTATGHESMDTDTTDKMDSGTYILQHGHYQIEVMANLDKVPSDRFSHRGELAQSAEWSRISGTCFCDIALAVWPGSVGASRFVMMGMTLTYIRRHAVLFDRS